MATKRNTQLHLAEPVNVEEIKLKVKLQKRQKIRRMAGVAIVIALIIAGTYLLLAYQEYNNVNTLKTYTNAGSDNNSYQSFGNGIVRYTSDGVVYLDKSNTVLWNQSYQIQNPVIEVNDQSFAIADQGGNTIMVFTEEGLKGEIETSLTIEKFTVSEQGIVSALLRDGDEPQIVSYDATGNVLVEHLVDVSTTGYPIALGMSPDGNLLGVSYLMAQDGVLTSKVIYYNFGSVGQDKTNHQVQTADYADTVMPTLYFMDADTSIAVGDNSFVIYEGTQIPEAKKTVAINKEIKSTFHTNRYIGFVLKNTDTSGYELRIYNASGNQVMSTKFVGEYSNIKMVGRQVIMFEGSRACIFGLNGIQKFRGRLTMDADDIIPVFGLNKYLLINANETQIVRLVK